jgi:hypothetical protein
MDPINYLATVPQIDLGQKFSTGLQAGAALNQLQQQQQSQQLAQQQAQQYSQDVQSALANPTPQNFAALAAKYPDKREAVKQAWDGMSAADQKAEGDTMAQAYSALLAGKPDIAKQVVQTQIDARKNAGLDTSHYDNALALLDADPQQAQGALGFALSHIADPKDFAAKFGALQGEQRNADLAPVTLADKQADVYAKNQGILAQSAGALAKPGVKPAQAIAMFKSMEARGILPKGGAQDYIDAMPTDAKDLPDYLAGVRDAGIKADDQKKYTTPDANAQLSADTQLKTTRMNNATQLAVQDRIAARQDSKGDTEPTLDQDTLTTMAQQYLAGDKGVMQNLGRGAQGSANVVALRQAITREAKSQGLSGPQIAAKMAEFAGTMAGQRTAGTRIANVEMAANEAANLVPLAQQASADVVRSGFLPFGKAQLMFDNQTNDPAMRKFVAANNSLVNAYSRAISPSGTPSVSDKEHAREMLSTAFDHNSYVAVTNQMLREIEAARQAPQAVRSAFTAGVTGQGHGSVPGAADHPADISALLKKYGGK